MDFNFLNMSKAEFIKKALFITLGSLINAASVNIFLIPSKLLNGGLSGVSLILNYLTNIPVGLSLLIFNIPLLILSILKVNKKFTVFTIIGTLTLSLWLMITSPLSKVLPTVTDANRILYCIYGGVLGGLGLGIVFSNSGSTGGIDIISVMVKKKYNTNIGTVSFTINFIIISIGAAFFGLETGLYTLIVMYMSSSVVDKVLKGFGRQKMFIIVTRKENEVASAIMKKLHRGITILYGEGAYTKERMNILYCIVSPKQLPRLKELVLRVDENAFMSITDTSEVQGKGFVNPL